MNKNTLRGKKIGITAIDLEQSEHRGIAVVTKSLIELLHKYGADIYLITGIEASRIRHIGKISIRKKLLDEIYISDFLKSLQKGANYRETFNNNFRYRIKLCIKLIFTLFSLLIRNFNYKYRKFELSEDHKSIKNQYFRSILGIFLTW